MLGIILLALICLWPILAKIGSALIVLIGVASLAQPQIELYHRVMEYENASTFDLEAYSTLMVTVDIPFEFSTFEITKTRSMDLRVQYEFAQNNVFEVKLNHTEHHFILPINGKGLFTFRLINGQVNESVYARVYRDDTQSKKRDYIEQIILIAPIGAGWIFCFLLDFVIKTVVNLIDKRVISDIKMQGIFVSFEKGLMFTPMMMQIAVGCAVALPPMVHYAGHFVLPLVYYFYTAKIMTYHIVEDEKSVNMCGYWVFGGKIKMAQSTKVFNHKGKKKISFHWNHDKIIWPK